MKRILLLVTAALMIVTTANAQLKRSETTQTPSRPQAQLYKPEAQVKEMQRRIPGTPFVNKAPKKASNVDLWYRRPAGAFPTAIVVEDGANIGMYYAPYIHVKPYADYTFLSMADGLSNQATFEWDVQFRDWGEDGLSKVQKWTTIEGQNLTWQWGYETDSVPIINCIVPNGLFSWFIDGHEMSGSSTAPIAGAQHSAKILSAPSIMEFQGNDILKSSKTFTYGGRHADQRYPLTYISGAEPYPGNESGWWFGKNGYHYIDNPRYVVDGIAQAFEKPEHPYLLNKVVLDCGVLEVAGQCEMQCRIYKLDEIPAYNDTTDVYLPEVPGELIATGRATLTPETAETTGDLVFFTLYGEEDGLEYAITPTIDCAILVCIDGYNVPEMANLADFSAMICSDDEVDEGFGELAYLKFGEVDEYGDANYVWKGLNNFFSSGTMKTGLTIFLSTELPFLTFNYYAEDGEYTFPAEGGLMEKNLGYDTTRSIEFWTSVPCKNDAWSLSCLASQGNGVPEWLSIELTDSVDDFGNFIGCVNAEVVADPLPDGIVYREAIVRFGFPGAYLDYKFMQGNAEPDEPAVIGCDFELDGIMYRTTSDAAVKVLRPSHWDVDHYDPYCDEDADIVDYYLDFIIPNHVTYNNKDYTVTEIGDSAFFFLWASDVDDEELLINYNINIPETVISIGNKAFGGVVGMVNVFCQSQTPPLMSDIVDFYSDGIINLFVSDDTYSLYKEANNQNHIFDSIYTTNGERSDLPIYTKHYLSQPVEEGPYGCAVKIFPNANSTIYIRTVNNFSGLYNHIYTNPWEKFENRDSIYYYYEPEYDGGAFPDGWAVEFFAVDEGKSPSHSRSCGLLDKCSLSYKWQQSFDFIDSNIAFSDEPYGYMVTFQGYLDPHHYYKGNSESDKLLSGGSSNQSPPAVKSDYYFGFEEADIINYYSGDVIIPSIATYHNYDDDTYTTGSVSEIGPYAFRDCVNMTSITIPSSVSCIWDNSFCGCTGLTRVNITNLEAWCNIYYDIYDFDNINVQSPLEYAHHLYLNGTEVTDPIIPKTVNYLSHTFSGCTGLNSVTISGILGMDETSFKGCTNLTFVKSLSKDPNHAYHWEKKKRDYEVRFFDECVYQNATLYVPMDAVEAYRQAEGWKYFQNIVGIYVNDFECDGIYYSITGDHEVVVSRGEEAYSGRMVIPESVTVDGVTYTVTGIADGAFTNANLDFLSIPVAITDNIANNAFEGSNINSVHIAGEGSWNDGALPANVETLCIGSGVTSVEGLQVNPATIYSYASVPPACDANTFTGYDATLHVPASSLAAYFTAPYWCNFINIIGDAVEPTELAIDNDSINVLVGNQIQLNATIVPNNATPNVITWTSSNDSIATVNDGNITAVGVGECNIKARLLNKVAICHVTVTEIAPTQITLSQEFAKMEVGSQLTLTATVLPEDATDKTVTWSTTNSAVATIDSQGNVMAIGPGECFITATCRDKQAMCHVIVVEHFINIQLDQHELLLLPNHIELLTPTVTPVSTDLAVTSTNPSVAAARLANGKIQVVGIAEGTTTIRVNSTDGYAEPDSCVVKVYTLRGDVNGDGFVNISDATLLISYLVAPSETIHQVNADTNNDGQINISDATRLISYLLTGEELEPKPDNEFETETITVNGVSFDMVSVEGGTFMMGATPEQGDEALDKEKPVHRVTVSSFAMSQTEVTQELWQAVMGNNPSHFTGDPKRPVELVSWNDCQTFIAQLNQLTGKRFRLPTEAEWEYAARGGNRYKVTRYAGSNNIDEVAWYDANSGNTTHSVATKAPNELGLYDMTGNVWEWCQDWYALYSADDQTDPTGPETGNNRVLRGGCWNGGTNYDRISFRDNFRPSGSNSSGGLRLVLDQEVVYTVNGVSFTMVPVKGGTFTMGATEEEDADHATFVASPKHQVTLSNFSIGQTEVTQELWVAVMGSNPSQDTSNLQYPVSYINWPDCDSFITKLNELTGLHFRLPTEAEWEYAAKGGANSQGFVYSGSDDLDEVAWISTNSDSHPHQVATKKANELGLYDMNGNIEEWCHDWYSLYTEDPVVNPSGPETGMSKVHRGGRWNGGAKYCRLTRRDGFSQGVKRNYMGMRLAL